MKCQSVACIWSGAPPLHRISAAAVLNQPPTLYTGGYDGSIIWWNLSGDQSNQEIWPVAMLCGHTAPISDLNICWPVGAGDGGSVEVENSSNVITKSASAGYGALISACTDGVLCIWSRSSGHCRRRRKMPPWVGSPSIIRTLPSSPRYVCIACSVVDSVHTLHHHSEDRIEEAEPSVDGESLHRKASSKCVVVIVDSYSLNIIQTVFHGNLSVGPLKFVAVVPAFEDIEKESVIMVGAMGKVQLVMISLESDPDGEGGAGLQKSSSSHSGISDWVHEFVERGQVISVATHGKLLVLIYKTKCIFRLLDNGQTLGEISLLDTSLCDDGPSTQSYLTGGMFLDGDHNGELEGAWDQPELFVENFAVWSSRGAAIVYTLSVSSDTFKFEHLCEIPAVSCPLDARISVRFCQLKSYLLRIESTCYNEEESFLWKPHITIWLFCERRDANGDFDRRCKMLGMGGFLGDCVERSCYLSGSQDFVHNAPMASIEAEGEVTSWQGCVPSSTNLNGSLEEDGKNAFGLKRRIVSSSMVLSGKSDAPYGIVYGFYSGEIEVIRFEISFREQDSVVGSSHKEVAPHLSEQHFLGHTGAILCLAAQHLVRTPNGGTLTWVLVSGSMDCTIRIWDLNTSSLITVMHHHVAPVRQIILPQHWTDRPWNNCFLSVGEDACVTVASLETFRVERMFPGHPSCPSMVVWDGTRGYIACLCRNHSGVSDILDLLYLWDVKTGARERVIRGNASHAMFDHFCRGANVHSTNYNMLVGTTSASSLLLPIIEDGNLSQSNFRNLEKGATSSDSVQRRVIDLAESNSSVDHATKGKSAKQITLPLYPIKCSSPFPGIASLRFDLASLMSPCGREFQSACSSGNKENTRPVTPTYHHEISNDNSDVPQTAGDHVEEYELVKSLEGCLICFSISFLHLWGVDQDLDRLLISELNVSRPEKFVVASGLQGDRGSVTLTFPGLPAALELWRTSSEFCAMLSLTMVSLAQRIISLSSSSSAVSSALAAFYTRNFAEKVPDISPPLLQLLVSFWQDESEHVRMAARSLFHCAAARAIPLPLSCPKETQHAMLPSSINGEEENENLGRDVTTTSRLLHSDLVKETMVCSQFDESSILAWLESFEMQDWVSCVGGASQDAMASHIIVAAALAIWYPSLVKPTLANLVIQPLMKLVMAVNEKYSSTAAELLAEGMECTWKACIGSEIFHLIGDIIFQIEFLSVSSGNSAMHNPAVAVTIRETLVDILLPSLAMADLPGFLNAIESQIWATASDSPVHLVSLMTLIRVVRGSPKPLAQYLDKVVNFIFQTMDPGNSVMRKTCLQSSMAALKEVVRVFPMVALNEALSRLAVGDAIGDINNVTIRVYDMQSVSKVKVLDASGPPGLPSLLQRASETTLTTAISALSFSPDGEGLVAFSGHGLMIRWWSLGSAWWEKLSRSLTPVQCTKLIFVPPWEGFSPNSSRSSIMASIMGNDRQEKSRGSNDVDSLKLLIHNLDLSYRLEWVGERKVQLMRHGQELGCFQL
ncbi:uncharacterized protein LOC122069658 isoform X2 [Macadamia integrifolia]|uniref:uncharacterized protein LOC122069658 isoform X2 n=1 Tax=Macadamia integrifolia TaxID=60698 RepID=UPI001C4E8BE1|nr:uncharacterized protein LOC122069658 isoform X2 [Macadamia integrifolia]